VSRELELPMPAESLIPHRRPMRLVDTLLSRDDDGGVTESCLPADAPLADAGGALDEVAFVEMIAQSFAAIKGHADRAAGLPPGRGYLVGISRMKIAGAAFAGDRLRTSVRTVGSFAGFAVVEGTVTRGADPVAAGTLKLWLSDPERRGGGGP
jgi:predicted hotdog family 3-hydroxylacyl-ACP dehydratase